MQIKRILASKRAQGDSTTVMELARKWGLEIFGVLFVIFIWSTMSTIYAAEPIEQTGKVSLERFADAMAEITNGSDTQVVLQQFSLTSEQVLIVFGPDSAYTVAETCARNENVEKPLDLCEPNQFCACIYDEDNLDKKPFDCKNVLPGAFKEVYAEPYETFGANLGERLYKLPGEPKSRTVIYADCWSSGETLGLRNLLLEAKVEGGQTYIKISDNACGNTGQGVCRTPRSCKGTNLTYPCPRTTFASTCCSI
jgi:hypothetical protein